jgi:hypothetical protein
VYAVRLMTTIHQQDIKAAVCTKMHIVCICVLCTLKFRTPPAIPSGFPLHWPCPHYEQVLTLQCMYIS